jgi:hypothetical protein
LEVGINQRLLYGIQTVYTSAHFGSDESMSGSTASQNQNEEPNTTFLGDQTGPLASFQQLVNASGINNRNNGESMNEDDIMFEMLLPG